MSQEKEKACDDALITRFGPSSPNRRLNLRSNPPDWTPMIALMIICDDSSRKCLCALGDGLRQGWSEHPSKDNVDFRLAAVEWRLAGKRAVLASGWPVLFDRGGAQVRL